MTKTMLIVLIAAVVFIVFCVLTVFVLLKNQKAVSSFEDKLEESNKTLRKAIDDMLAMNERIREQESEIKKLLKIVEGEVATKVNNENESKPQVTNPTPTSKDTAVSIQKETPVKQESQVKAEVAKQPEIMENPEADKQPEFAKIAATAKNSEVLKQPAPPVNSRQEEVAMDEEIYLGDLFEDIQTLDISNEHEREMTELRNTLNGYKPENIEAILETFEKPKEYRPTPNIERDLEQEAVMRQIVAMQRENTYQAPERSLHGMQHERRTVGKSGKEYTVSDLESLIRD